MQGINTQNVVIIVSAIVALWMVIKFLKGLVKLIITLILIFTLALSAYNIFVVGKPISYEVNRYKTDTGYFFKAAAINKDAYSALQQIKENKNREENTKKLEELEKEAEMLEHSEESNMIHHKYISNFKMISEGAKAYNAANGYIDKANNFAKKDKLLDISLMDLLFNK